MTKFATFLMLLITVVACNDVATQNIRKLAPADFKTTISEKEAPQLVDVRTPEEYKDGHLENAKNININDDDFEAMLGNFDKEKPLFLYCGSGVRSARASNMAAKLGFKEVYDMEGGIGAWSANNLPVIR